MPAGSIVSRKTAAWSMLVAVCLLTVGIGGSSTVLADEDHEEHEEHEEEHADLPVDEAVETARGHLETARSAYDEGDTEAAEKKVKAAYLEGFEAIEGQLASKDKEYVEEVEHQFHELERHLRKDDDKVGPAFDKLGASLGKAPAILSEDSTPWVAGLASGGIILREGVEAVLLIALLLGVLGKLEEYDSRKYVHAGWISALVAGGLTWVAAETIISISNVGREVMEGIVALLAAAVLFWVSYWLFSQLHGKKWMEHLKKRVHEAVSGQSRFALVGIAFLAVYREAFETVLMYQGLLIQSPNQTGAILGGLAIGVGILGVVSYFILTAGKKLPLGTLFTSTSGILYGLCIVFTGAGIHELQEGGVLTSYAINFPKIGWLGIYPDLIGLFVQGLLVFGGFVAIGVYLGGEDE